MAFQFLSTTSKYQYFAYHNLPFSLTINQAIQNSATQKPLFGRKMRSHCTSEYPEIIARWLVSMLLFYETSNKNSVNVILTQI